MADARLRQLERQLQTDISVLPAYIHYYLKVYNTPPPERYPLVHYRCVAHDQLLHAYAHPRMECPGTYIASAQRRPGDQVYSYEGRPCHFSVELGDISRWIGDAQDPNNLFRLKKTRFPDPSDPEEFYSAFAAGYADHPAALLFPAAVHDFYGRYMWNIITIIAELRIPPPMPNWPLVPITTEEMIEITNLRTDLIEGSPSWCTPSAPDCLNKNMGFLPENAWPLRILGATILGRDRLGSPYRSNQAAAVTFDPRIRWNELESWRNDEPIMARYSHLG